MTSFSRVLPVLSLSLAAALAPRVAHADEPAGTDEAVDDQPARAPVAVAPAQVPVAKPVAKPEATRERWYGWQGLIVDGASILLVTPAIPPLGVGGYFLGAPIVHAAHGRWGAAGGSVLLRIGLPVVGAIVANGGTSDRSCGEFGCLRAVVGAGVGILAAIAVDAAALSWETVPVTREDRADKDARSQRRSLAVAPGIAPRREGGVDVGLSGTF